jgi:arylsulfatase A-like enzyme
VAKLASEYLEASKPNLLFVHMPDADIVGHEHGWDSPEQIEALSKVDAAIGQVRQAMLNAYAGKNFALIVTADHGGSGKDHWMFSSEDTTIPWITWGTFARKNLSIPQSVSTMDTAATALWLLGVPVPHAWEGIPLQDAYF